MDIEPPGGSQEHGNSPESFPRPLPDISPQTLGTVSNLYVEDSPFGDRGGDLIELAQNMSKATRKTQDARDRFLEQLADANPDFLEGVAAVSHEMEELDHDTNSIGIAAVLDAYDLETQGELMRKIKEMSPEDIASQKENWREMFSAFSKGNPYDRALRAPRLPEENTNLIALKGKLANYDGTGNNRGVETGIRVGYEMIRRIGLPSASTDQSVPQPNGGE